MRYWHKPKSTGTNRSVFRLVPVHFRLCHSRPVVTKSEPLTPSAGIRGRDVPEALPIGPAVSLSVLAPGVVSATSRLPTAWNRPSPRPAPPWRTLLSRREHVSRLLALRHASEPHHGASPAQSRRRRSNCTICPGRIDSRSRRTSGAGRAPRTAPAPVRPGEWLRGSTLSYA